MNEMSFKLREWLGSLTGLPRSMLEAHVVGRSTVQKMSFTATVTESRGPEEEEAAKSKVSDVFQAQQRIYMLHTAICKDLLLVGNARKRVERRIQAINPVERGTKTARQPMNTRSHLVRRLPKGLKKRETEKRNSKSSKKGEKECSTAVFARRPRPYY
jgi:hypothetical protein